MVLDLVVEVEVLKWIALSAELLPVSFARMKQGLASVHTFPSTDRRTVYFAPENAPEEFVGVVLGLMHAVWVPDLRHSLIVTVLLGL